MYNLFLDDKRIPYSVDKDIENAFAVVKNPIYYQLEWVIVRNYYQFVKAIKDQGMPSIISFDHDLGKRYKEADIPVEFINDKNKNEILNTEKTGYDALKWLANHCLDNEIDLPKIYLHTANTVGLSNMQDYIKSFEKMKKLDDTKDS